MAFLWSGDEGSAKVGWSNPQIPKSTHKPQGHSGERQPLVFRLVPAALLGGHYQQLVKVTETSELLQPASLTFTPGHTWASQVVKEIIQQGRMDLFKQLVLLDKDWKTSNKKAMLELALSAGQVEIASMILFPPNTTTLPPTELIALYMKHVSTPPPAIIVAITQRLEELNNEMLAFLHSSKLTHCIVTKIFSLPRNMFRHSTFQLSSICLCHCDSILPGQILF